LICPEAGPRINKPKKAFHNQVSLGIQLLAANRNYEVYLFVHSCFRHSFCSLWPGGWRNEGPAENEIQLAGNLNRMIKPDMKLWPMTTASGAS
jgi:hypothetical protein